METPPEEERGEEELRRGHNGSGARVQLSAGIAQWRIGPGIKYWEWPRKQRQPHCLLISPGVARGHGAMRPPGSEQAQEDRPRGLHLTASL